MRISSDDPNWTAPRTGWDWQDGDVLLTTAWLSELVERRSWRRRLENTQDFFLRAKTSWAKGKPVPLYDPADTAAWYIFQATAYATDRMNWVPEEAVRMVPTFTRLGKEIETVLSIPGVEDRARRMMNAEKRQVDAGLFELLVALAYSRHGWRTRFVPEQPGGRRTCDLEVQKGRRKWAVECKRMDRSSYDARERARGEALAQPVHALALAATRSIHMQVVFDADLDRLPDDYLVRFASAYLDGTGPNWWRDDNSVGTIAEIDWRLAHSVLAVDDVYYGSSRLIELLIGRYDHDFAHSIAAKWRPSPERPFWASAVYQASVVRWQNRSIESLRRKARHFRAVVAKAAEQLPGDRPGVVHVGVESWSGTEVDGFRHLLNTWEMMNFDPEKSRLRWVYGEYMAPEATTNRNESWAIEETSVPYRIGRHRTAAPLPNHLLIGSEDVIHPGAHWDRNVGS